MKASPSKLLGCCSPSKSALFLPILFMILLTDIDAKTHADTFYGADYVDGIIYKFDTSIEDGTAFASMPNPYRLAVDSTGNLYAANPFTNIVEKFDASGNGATFAAVGTNGINGIAFDHHGDLFVVNNLGVIYQVSATGNAALFTNSGFASASALAFDTNNNLYLAAGGPNYPAVYKFNDLGNMNTFATNGLDQPVGMAFDASGDLWVGNNGSQGLSVFDTNGDETFFITGFYHNLGVAFDHNGKLYVSTVGSPSGIVAGFEPTDPGNPAPIYGVYNINDPVAIAFAPVFQVPLLQITNTIQQVIVFWQDDHQNHTLQTTINLASSVWSNAPILNWTNGPLIGLAMSNPPALSSSFYRLKY
jgi:hypothetical protein